MHYLALALDYDGTLARNGQVDPQTIAALRGVLDSGRKLVLVTGRTLDDLGRAFSEVELFSRVVAENGALVYDPATRSERLLAKAPPAEFLAALREGNVSPLATGKAIVATWNPQAEKVLSTIRDLGLELQVIFNKGAVMILPSGVNKGTGLKKALREMGLSAHNVVGVGDAENDHAFLELCGCSVAVANALNSVKKTCDIVTASGWGAGVVEIAEELVRDDLENRSSRILRNRISLGTDEHGNNITIPGYGPSLLIAGPSGSGKSSALTGILERLRQRSYQVCIFDPEGDYDDLPEAVHVGDVQHPPITRELLDLIDRFQDPVVNLLGVTLADRPAVFASLLTQVQERRSRTGRPHWLIVDEAHHMLPESWQPGPAVLPQHLYSAIFVTVHPSEVSPAVLRTVSVAMALGKDPCSTLSSFAKAADLDLRLPNGNHLLGDGEALCWFRDEDRRLQIKLERTESDLRRHRRKYAAGDIQENSFYFRGPDGKLNLRAQNLNVFVQMAEGVDDNTWMHHLSQHDYSRWIRDAVKDDELADQIAAIEFEKLSPAESRARIIAAIEKQYTRAA